MGGMGVHCGVWCCVVCMHRDRDAPAQHDFYLRTLPDGGLTVKDHPVDMVVPGDTSSYVHTVYHAVSMAPLTCTYA